MPGKRRQRSPQALFCASASMNWEKKLSLGISTRPKLIFAPDSKTTATADEDL
jgi:hypothetical protein